MFTVAVESELGVSLPPVIFTQSPSCQATARYLQSSRSDSGNLTLVSVHKGDGPQLFLTPGMWGNNAYAMQFSADMAPDIGVWTFHLTDPANRQKQLPTIEHFAAECAGLIRSVQPEGPYHLAGHSFGGLLAFEIARHLLAAGQSVGCIGLIDVTASLASRKKDSAGKRDTFVIDYYRAMAENYIAQPLDTQVHYFRAKDSPYLTCSDISGGWAYVARRGAYVHDIEGDHQSIIRGSSRAAIARFAQSAMQGKNEGLFVPPLAISEQVRTWLDSARSSAMADELAKEIECYTSAIAADDALPQWVYGNYAQALFIAGRIEEATKAYEASLTRDTWPLTSYRRFALLLRKHDLIAQGRAVMAAISAIKTNSVAAAYAKAKIYSAFGDMPNLLKALQEGIALCPRSLELRSLLANALADMGKGDAAREQIRLTLTHIMENDMVLLNLGVLAMKLGDNALAEQCLQQTLAIDPYCVDAYLLLGQIEAQKGNVQQAATLEEKAELLMQGIRFK